MEFISVRFISATVFVFTSALFLAPLVRAKSATNASFPRVAEVTHEITLAEAAPKPNQPRSEAIRRYLADIFGVPGFKTSWYDDIIDIEVTGDTATVRTNLSPGDKRISNICGVISGFIYSHLNAHLGIRKVKILGSAGEVLVFRRSPLDGCPP